MTARTNEGKYEVCVECGAHLDHGEECDCEEERASEQSFMTNEGDVFEENVMRQE